jgi:Protein of unknown function (DUF2442)
MFLRVKRVLSTKDYVLRVEFTDDVVKDVDLSGELHGEVFEPLRDPEFFKEASVNEETGAVEWRNGADFAPEFLYEIGGKVEEGILRRIELSDSVFHESLSATLEEWNSPEDEEAFRHL